MSIQGEQARRANSEQDFEKRGSNALLAQEGGKGHNDLVVFSAQKGGKKSGFISTEIDRAENQKRVLPRGIINLKRSRTLLRRPAQKWRWSRQNHSKWLGRDNSLLPG